MLHLVTSENRDIYRGELREMHAHRKRVFIDQLGWPLEPDGDLEFDAFDTDTAIYLLSLAQDGQLRASARMLRTDEAHLLDTVFPHLCDAPPPRGDSIWEATRFCPSADIEAPEERRMLLGEIIAGILEAGLLFGITEVTYVVGGATKPLALAAGWQARQLGPTQRYKRDRVTACIASIDAGGLRRVRERYGLTAPLLRYLPARRAA